MPDDRVPEKTEKIASNLYCIACHEIDLRWIVRCKCGATWLAHRLEHPHVGRACEGFRPVEPVP